MDFFTIELRGFLQDTLVVFEEFEVIYN
ncbi:hypothetical protein GOQ29_12140 [Clostridium sp. D2Q-14]|nr:hypothetical protein [Anaeromonas gelatinilytica]